MAKSSRASGKKNKRSLTIVVQGEETEVEASVNAALQSVVSQALNQTKNEGRPPKDWKLKTKEGDVLDVKKSLSDYGVPNNVLYLSLREGGGGCYAA